jgi:hypothetical protein
MPLTIITRVTIVPLPTILIIIMIQSKIIILTILMRIRIVILPAIILILIITILTAGLVRPTPPALPMPTMPQ